MGGFPTPYADVNAVLAGLLGNLRDLLGGHFTGMYLHGSLATGDFNPVTSDIDFLVVTTDELPAGFVPALAALHRRMADGGSRWARRIEGAYIPRHAIRRYDPVHATHPWTGADGHFAVEHLHSDWVIQRHILRERGVVLAGPHPRTMIDPVSADELRQAVRAILREWWARKLEDHGWLKDEEYQAFAILTMCRALHTLHHGDVVSKPVAARWALNALGEPWPALIEQAMSWSPEASHQDMTGALDFIRYTLNRARFGDTRTHEGGV
jgi:hypothetical protein